jgi:hypothetical protein
MKKHQVRHTYDWVALKAEWIISDAPSLSRYFAKKGIAKRTWAAHSPGWIDARQQHRQNVADMLQKRDADAKILTVQKQQEVMSSVFVGVVNLWQRVYKKIAEHDSATQGVGAPMSQTQYNEALDDLGMITRLMPDLIKTNELLAGRPTGREDAADADKMLAKRVGELKATFEKRRERLAKEIEAGGFKIGSVEDAIIEEPTQAEPS